MERYYYTKDVKQAPFVDLLRIRLSKDLWRKIRIATRSTAEDNVCIESDIVLTSDELDEIAVAINEYSNAHPFVMRHQVELETMNPNATFGQVLIDKISSNNIVRNRHMTLVDDNGTPKSLSQIMIERNQLLIISLLIGSLDIAYQMTLSFTPDETITQEEIDEYLKRLELQMGI